MNHHQIHCFLTVAETLNFSTAANRLYMSQPAITYQIKSLEKELGVTLFQRTTTTTELTHAGQTFLKDALLLKNVYNQALMHLQEIHGLSRIVIACPPGLVTYDNDILVSISKKVIEETQLPLEAQIITDPKAAIQDLIAGRVHLVISAMRYAVSYNDKLRICPMFQCKNYVILSSSHPLSKKESLTLDDLADQTIYLSASETCYLPILQQLLQAKSIPVTYRQEKNYDMIMPYVAMGYGISCSSIKFSHSSDICFIPLSLENNITIALCSSRDNLNPSLNYARQIIQNLFTDYREGNSVPDKNISSQ